MSRTFRKTRVATNSGYTIVEVIMALAVLAIGGMGVVSLQKFTVLGAVNARGIAAANSAAEGWIDVFQNEAVLWNYGSNLDPQRDMPILGPALAAPGTWKPIPATQWTPFGGGTPASPPGVYPAPAGVTMLVCTQFRAYYVGQPLPPAAGATLPNGASATDTVRVDLRTWYAKDGRDVSAECANVAGVNTLLTTGTASLGGVNRSRWEYGFVYYTGAVRRNTLL